jgi:hypothetical protein
VLLDMGLPGLPVTQDEGQVIGFLSRADILRAVVADRRWTSGPEFSRLTTAESNPPPGRPKVGCGPRGRE